MTVDELEQTPNMEGMTMRNYRLERVKAFSTNGRIGATGLAVVDKRTGKIVSPVMPQRGAKEWKAMLERKEQEG